jgi:hypothetical protein
LARAKRTDRADARRRNRASYVDRPDDEPEEEAPAAPAAARGGRRAATAGPARPAANVPPRPGIISAFRASFRPIDVRGDIRALPWLLRTPGFLAAVGLSGLSVALIPLAGAGPLTDTLYQYFSYTAPLGLAFLIGFFAPRASYLLGIIAALASFAFQAIAFSNGSFGGTLVGAHDVNNNPIAPRDLANTILNQALFLGVPWAAFFASAAAWYRRFLRTANPSRQRQAPGGRRPDGKVAKRSEGRPMLARRR